MSKEALDVFGSLLMRRVRDRTISEWDKIVDGQMKGLTAEHVQEILVPFDAQQVEALHQLIPRIVDTSLHYLLWMLEQEKSVSISVRTDTEVVPNLQEISDGLAGELYGQRGWITKFSKQRYKPY